MGNALLHLKAGALYPPLKSNIRQGGNSYICSCMDSEHGLWRKEEREGATKYEFPPGQGKQNRTTSGKHAVCAALRSEVCSLRWNCVKIHNVYKRWVFLLMNLDFPPSGKVNLADFNGKHIFEIKKDTTWSASEKLSHGSLHGQKHWHYCRLQFEGGKC